MNSHHEGKFLACARPSKLTTKTHTHTHIYIYICTHGVLLYCISCPRNTDYWCCAISSSTAFFTPDFFLHCYLHFWSSSNAPMKSWSILYVCVQMLWHVFTAKYWYNKTHWWIHTVHVFFLHFHKCRTIFFVSMDNIILCDFSHKTWRGTTYFVLWDWNNRCPNVNEWI